MRVGEVDIYGDLKSKGNYINVANLIYNGSFEYWYHGTSGVPSDPTNLPEAYAEEGTPGDVSRDTGETGLGSYSVKITADDVTEGIKITLSGLKKSTSYSVSVRTKVTDGDTSQLLTTGADTDISVQESTSTSWATLTGTFTTDATPTNVVIKLLAKASGDIVWFDGLMIVEGSAPFAFSPHPEDNLYEQETYWIGAVTIRSESGCENNYGGVFMFAGGYAFPHTVDDTLLFPFPLSSKINNKTRCIDEITIYYGIRDGDAAENNAVDYINVVGLISGDLDSTVTSHINHGDDLGKDTYNADQNHQIVDTMHEMTDFPYNLYVEIVQDATMKDIRIYGFKILSHRKNHE